jgi:hypothetical protein
MNRKEHGTRISSMVGWALCACLIAPTYSHSQGQVLGGGTVGTIPVWTATHQIGNSNLTQNTGGTVFTFGTTASPATAIASLQDNGGQVFNVRACGATGNGTTDDSTAINSCITTAISSGGGLTSLPGPISYKTK